MDGDSLDESAVFPGDGGGQVEAGDVAPRLDSDFDDGSEVQMVVHLNSLQVTQRPVTTLGMVVRVKHRNQPISDMSGNEFTKNASD